MVAFTALVLALAQSPDSTAYLDAQARVLVARARAAQDSLESTIQAYTAVVKQRIGVALRTPLKDRTLYRSEAAARIRWHRDDMTVIKVLGARQYHPGMDYTDVDIAKFSMDELFDPSLDRLYFGLTYADDEDVWIDHPLLEGAEEKYRYQTGDTITMGFPDGKQVRVVELRVLPRRNAVRLISGSVWIEPVSGAIVKAAYRLPATFNMERDTDVFEDDDDLEHVPGIFKPFELDFTMISVEYSYWRLKHWLPRALRMEGTARAGIIKAPAAMEISYDIQEVEEVGDSSVSARQTLREWRTDEDHVDTSRRDGRRRYAIIPDDREKLIKSPDLPPPVWDSSPDFITEKELRSMYGGLAQLPLPPALVTNVTVRWGLQAQDLLRFNRVEGPSVGVRVEAQRTAATYWSTARLGLADLAPNLEVGARRETLRRTLTASASHGLVAIDARSLQLGSSVSALVLGRDDGEYYRATALRFAVSPPPARAEWYRLTLFAERQRSAARETDWSLPHFFDRGIDFRPNMQADAADLAGAELSLRGWYGSDPRMWQAGVELTLDGAAGDFRYGRATLTTRTAFPIVGHWRGALEAAGGSSEGGLPVQKQFFLGGAHTLRGYGGSAAVGSSFVRGRAELAYATSAVGLALFSDAGWAGERASFTTSQSLLSAGVGGTILDGLIRIDLARALRRPTGWRLELHLDAIL
ncbi:MAG: BamA/TamA family outer membrane protein [Longimicrobiales bacterium]